MRDCSLLFVTSGANGAIDHNLTTLVNTGRVWQDHRSHLYQGLVQSGWSHSRVAVVVMPCGAVVAGMAAWSTRAGNSVGQWMALVVAGIGFVVYAGVVAAFEALAGGDARSNN